MKINYLNDKNTMEVNAVKIKSFVLLSSFTETQPSRNQSQTVVRKCAYSVISPKIPHLEVFYDMISNATAVSVWTHQKLVLVG